MFDHHYNDYQYLDDFKEKLIIQLQDMIDNDGINNSQNAQNKKIMISFSKYDKDLIDKLVSFEICYKEIPSRTLILGNIPEGTTEEDIKYLLNKFGDYEYCDFTHLHKGKIIVKFYNLKDAMMMRTSTIYINFRSIIMSFGNEESVIDKKHPPNNGTIVIFNLPESFKDEEIVKKFEKFGDIRDIRKTPNKNNQRFIEFYDIRSAFKAKKEMKKKKLFIGKRFCKINVEYSLPGNYRANYEKYYNRTVPTIQRRTFSISN